MYINTTRRDKNKWDVPKRKTQVLMRSMKLPEKNLDHYARLHAGATSMYTSKMEDIDTDQLYNTGREQAIGETYEPVSSDQHICAHFG
jgi:hypothetical protein